MKKTLLLALLAVGNISFIYAQYGVAARVGLSLSTMTGVESTSSGTRIVPKPGFVTGVSGEFRLVEKDNFSLYLQPEFELQQKGYAARYTSGSYWSQNNYNLDYVSLPVAAKLMFGGGRFKGGLNFGVAPSLLVARSVSYSNSEGDKERNVINRSNVRAFDFNAFLGGVVEFQLGPGALFADLRYTQGFLNPFVNNFVSRTYLNAAPSFSIGYVFRFGSGTGSSSRSAGPSSVPSGQVYPEESISSEVETASGDKDETSTKTAQLTRPSEIDEDADVQQPQQLRPVPKPRESIASSASDFEEMIALNKHFDVVADVRASVTDKEVSKTEILSRFKHSDVLVKIEIDKVVVDYFSITEFIGSISLNHSRYKIVDRLKDEDGMISEITMRKIG